MASRNGLLPVWGLHVGGNSVLFFATGKKNKTRGSQEPVIAHLVSNLTSKVIFDFLLFGLFKNTKAAQCKNLVRYKNIFAYTHTQLNKKPRVIVFYFLIMTRVLINFCSIEELILG
jgi:hypothetical protein